MTLVALLEFIAATLDGGFGPDDEGYIEAAYNPATGFVEVAYTADDTGTETRINLEVAK